MVDESISKKILDFLQKYKFDLTRQVPGYRDAIISEDGQKLILRVAAPLLDEPNLQYEGERLPVEVKVDFPANQPAEGQVVVNVADRTSVVVAPKVQENQITTTALPMGAAVGPFESSGRSPEAYAEWKKRHKHVKVGG